MITACFPPRARSLRLAARPALAAACVRAGLERTQKAGGSEGPAVRRRRHRGRSLGGRSLHGSVARVRAAGKCRRDAADAGADMRHAFAWAHSPEAAFAACRPAHTDLMAEKPGASGSSGGICRPWSCRQHAGGGMPGAAPRRRTGALPCALLAALSTPGSVRAPRACSPLSPAAPAASTPAGRPAPGTRRDAPQKQHILFPKRGGGAPRGNSKRAGSA